MYAIDLALNADNLTKRSILPSVYEINFLKPTDKNISLCREMIAILKHKNDCCKKELKSSVYPILVLSAPLLP